VIENFFHINFKAKRTALAVYIGAKFLEIVLAKRSAKGKISIIKAIYKNIPEEGLSGQMIKDALLSEGIKETNIVTTIPEKSVMLRRFSMPIIPARERDNAVKFEAKRHIPFSINEVISNFCILKEDHMNNKMDILFAAVKKTEINSVMNVFNEAGLKVEEIEPISLALIKSLGLSGFASLKKQEDKSFPVIILHFAANDKAHIIVAENGTPYIKRDMFTIAEREGGIQEQILKQLRLSASYYKREFPEKNINKVIIYGLKKRPEWLEELGRSLNLPVEQAISPNALTGRDITVPQLEVPIGLAVCVLERHSVKLNLLPKGLIPVKYNLGKIVLIEIAAGILILGLIYLSGLPSSARLNNRLLSAQKAKTECPELNLSVESMEQLKKTEELWQGKKNILFVFTKQKVSWREKLIRLSDLIPYSVWVRRITFGDGIGIIGARVLILKCTAYTKNSLNEVQIANDFFHTLKKDKIFMKGFRILSLGTISRAKIDKYPVVNFDISGTQ